MLRFTRGFFFIAFLLSQISIICFGENSVHSQLKFNTLTVDDGLSYNKVNSICRDDLGFMWFGTNEGLNRFDGYNFKIYKNDNSNPYSISHNFVISLLLDHNSKFWIGTYDGLNLYDPEKDRFLKINDADSSSLGNIFYIFEFNDNELLIASQKGLYIIDKFKRIAKRCDKLKNLPYKNAITYIYRDHNANLWIGTRYNGLWLYDENGNFVNHFYEKGNPSHFISENWITTAYEDTQGNFWVGTFNNGINLFNKTDSSFTKISLDPNEPFSERVRDIIEDSNGRLWVGSRAGLYTKVKDKISFTRYAHSEHDVSVLSNNSVYDIYIDKQNVMWIGTYAGGVNYTDFNQKKFTYFIYKENNNRFLNDKLIYSVYEDKNKDVWIGTEKGGINVYRNKEGVFEYIKSNGRLNSLASNNIKSIVETGNGNLFIANYQGGINFLNRKTNEIKHYRYIEGDPFSLRSDNVYTLYYDSKDNLWVGNQTGTDILKKGSNKFEHLYLKSDNLIDSADIQIISIFEDSENNIWLGSYGKGIFMYDKDKYFIPVYKDLSNTIIYGFNEDYKNQLWICGEKGIYCIDKTSDTIYHFTDKDGLPSNNVFIALDDSKGNVWISTASGLSKFINGIETPDKKIFRNFDISDGLLSKQFFYNAYYTASDGKMYFGGVNGILQFYPDEIIDNPYYPDVTITNLKVFNKDVNIGDTIEGEIILNKDISRLDEVTLSYKHYVLILEFSAMHYANPQKNKYEYMLEGFEKQWNKTSANQRYATYTNLHGGEYNFKVRAYNNDGIMSKEATSLKITIIPPFWETTWFRILIIISIIVLTVLLSMLRIKNLKKQKRTLEKTVKERTKELRNANKVLTYQKETITKAYDNVKILSEFGQKLTSTLNPDEIIRMIFNYVNQLMDTTNFGIGIYNDKNDSLEFEAFMENGVSVPTFFSPLDDETSCGAWCFKNQSVIFSNNFLNDYKNYIKELNIRTSQKPQSLIYHPLSVENKKIGIITVQSYKINAYTDFDNSIIQSLASYLAISLDNANIYKELNKKNKLLQKQTDELNETNIQLEERQQQIEEQAEELKVQAEELSLRNKELNESNQTKDKLFSIVAHDLKNPFSTVLGFTELLIKRYDNINDEKRMTFIRNINNSVKIIFKLLENLLSWARSQTGKIELNPVQFSIKEIIQENINLFQNHAQNKNTQLKMVYEEEDVDVFADRNMINTVIRNLISNAVKYTDDGYITCSTELKKDNKEVEVSVSDTGTGIEPNKIDSIFIIEKSKSVEGTKGELGTGLGLIICKEFIEKNDGKISVVSKLGEGSTFKFTVPLYTPQN